MANKHRYSKAVSVITVIGFLLCALALIYPVIAQKWNAYRDAQTISEYRETVANKSGGWDDEIKRAEAYNEKLRNEGRTIVTDALYDPDAEYESLMKISADGMMGYIEIPSIDVEEAIYHYTTDDVLGRGVGHIHGSSLPVGGDSTHSVITGHRGLPNRRIFTDLDRLKAGDRFYLHVLGKVLAYQVFDIKEVLPSDVGSLMIEDGKDLCTLVTCTPYGVNTHRLLVTGKRIPYEETDDTASGRAESHRTVVDYSVYVLGGFLLFALVLTILFAVIGHKNRKKKKEEGKNCEKTIDPGTGGGDTGRHDNADGGPGGNGQGGRSD